MNRFARLELLLGIDNINKLSKKNVLIIGVGGVGGYVVESLVRSNIQNIILVDYDTIDITNINRQLIALNSTIGNYKVDILKMRIADINPLCKVTTHKLKLTSQNITTIFDQKIDFVIDACDDKIAKMELINYCIKENIPFISSMGTGNRLDPSKLTITTLDKTYNDPLAKSMRKLIDPKIQKKVPVCLSLELPKKISGSKIASSSFVPGSAGLLIASHVIKNLLTK